MLKEGLAWSRPSASGNAGVEALEELARAEGKGLWADPHPAPPWKWKAPNRASRKFSN
jgi:endonuclease YncB( thermonuclease family)